MENRVYLASGWATMFVCLNGVDAWLTTQLLHRGGVEAFWWSASFNSNMLVKGLLALAVSLALFQLGKPRLLLWLNIGMSVIVLLSGTGFLAYLAGFYSLL